MPLKQGTLGFTNETNPLPSALAVFWDPRKGGKLGGCQGRQEGSFRFFGAFVSLTLPRICCQ